MIENSFIFLEGISHKTEQSLWKQGISDWHSFLRCSHINGISPIRKSYYDRQILKARSALYSNDASFFQSHLPQSETWRLYDFFKDQAVFLDIETSGMSSYDDITLFGLFDGADTKTMIKGINLDYAALQKELKRYQLIVTYNGASFDIPFIKKRYPGVLPNIPNFDLRVACQRIGLTGGLKAIERKLGIRRNQLVEDLCGGDALTLWRMYKATGDEHYLNLLVEYNEEDVFNLRKVADFATSQLKENMYTKLHS
ncbi:MAG TPA: ribonuclease H-like domain-containing protein [Candidatus Nanoarchaeia archaeon]|nr:ribonuclease H-like domain-containing protein [Candidatus Nanoarchaeia archaeon]